MKMEKVSAEFIAFDSQDVITTSGDLSLYLSGSELNAVKTFGSTRAFVNTDSGFIFYDLYSDTLTGSYTDAYYYNVDGTKGTLTKNGEYWQLHPIVGDYVTEMPTNGVVGMDDVIKYLVAYQQ